MGAWYWGVEYGKVLLGYLFFMFLWPSVVFGGFLKEKSRTYRFSFCVTVQPVIASTVVLMLGLFHILHTQVIVVLFYGTFVASLLRRIVKNTADFRVRELRRRFLESLLRLRVHMVEYSVLSILLLFGMIYFSYGAFQVHSYGFSDLYTHHAWVYGLKEGRIFADGVYPEAMHCFIYCLNALFRIRVYSILLFLQGIHVVVFLLSGYLLLKEVFRWRYTPLLALMLFLTLDVVNADLVHGMARLQAALPLEFGLHTQFLCALYLARYLKSSHRIEGKGRLSRYCLDDNLLLFAISLAASISIHYHTTIMAFIICVSFVVFKLRQLFVKERFIPLAVTVACACIFAMFPMACALASGIPFNYSINWAVKAMDGEEIRNLEGKRASKETPRQEKPLLVHLFEMLKGVYEEGYAKLYGPRGAYVVLLVTGAGVVLCVFSRKKGCSVWLRETCAGYPPLILFTVLFVLLYAAPYLGYPEIIPGSRFCSTGHGMVMALMVMPVDVAFSILVRFCGEGILRAASIISVAAMYGLSIWTGHYHGYLFVELTRYNTAVEVTNLIIETFPEKSFVIVSPTDELYPVLEHGWHEELLTFVQNMDNEEYTYALGNAFIYVEKKPLQYAQAYFFDGPFWLAGMKYKDIYWNKYKDIYPDMSQAPQIKASEVSEEAAQTDLMEDVNLWSLYTQLQNRTILESKAYSWCQKFMELHPEKMEKYYEDDDFVCYHLTPNGGGL